MDTSENFFFQFLINYYIPNNVLSRNSPPKNVQTHIHTKSYEQTFKTALLRMDKQLKCPIVGELWHIYTRKYYSPMKKE